MYGCRATINKVVANFVVYYAIDDMEAHSVLTLEGYGSDKEDGWVLLEETPEEAVAGEGVA